MRDAARVRDKYRGALVGVAVGDSFGAFFEGRPGPVSREHIDRVERGVFPWHHTDDTAMTIALADSLLSVGDLDQDHVAGCFARHWEREPARGYGSGTAFLLAQISDGEHWKTAAADQFGGQGSYGNGAAMRVAPVALHAAGDPDLSAALGRSSAEVTHTHPLGIGGAAIQATAVALALAQPPNQPIDVARFVVALQATASETVLVEQLDQVSMLAADGTAEEIAAQLGTGIAAHEAVPAAICTFLRHSDSFAETIRFAISLGGDTDTIAAMAGAIAGAYRGEHAIPTAWIERTERAGLLGERADRFAYRVAPAT